MKVSSLQTGLFAGPLGSKIGQSHFSEDLVVREEQASRRLYTPTYGVIETRLKAIDDPRNMVALWMIGYEDEPNRSAEICVCEIFGKDVEPDRAKVGMGLHPFGDPDITDEFAAEPLPIDAREFHVYAAEWAPEGVTFYVDGLPVKTVDQSPAYPMQLMLEHLRVPGRGAAAGRGRLPEGAGGGLRARVQEVDAALRDPEAPRHQPPLRLPPGDRRRLRVVGGAEGPVDRPARQAPRHAGRRSPARRGATSRA